MRGLSTLRSPVILAIAALCGAFLLGQQADANVFAAHLNAPTAWNFVTQGPMNITYRLNQPATSVSIEIFRASDTLTTIKTIAGTTSYGLNTVQWDGTKDGGGNAPSASDYKYRIIAADSVGVGSWTNITPLSSGNEIGSAQYYCAAGVAVNRDINSPNFGRIYIASSYTVASSNPGATAAGDGLFLLNNDLSFRGGSAATAAAAANASLVTNGTSTLSPWKCNINPDNSDEVVLGDDYDSMENVWIFNGDGSTVDRILDASTTGPTTGAAYNHGNSLDVWLAGTGSDRKLWHIDEDKDVGTTRGAGGLDIIRYDIGTTTSNYTGQGTEVLNGAKTFAASPPYVATTNFYTGRGLCINKAQDKLYVVCRRANNSLGNMAVTRYSLSGGVVVGADWTKQNPDMTTITGMAWKYTAAIALDEDRDLVAVSSNDPDANQVSGGQVAILKASDGTFLATFDSGGKTHRDLDFDAAGNLITTNQTDEHVRIFSPPGANSFTTPSLGDIDVTACPPGTVPVALTGNPSSQNVALGGTAIFSASATGTGLSYEWRNGLGPLSNGGDISGANTNTLTISNVDANDAKNGPYFVVVSGDCGAPISSTSAALRIAIDKIGQAWGFDDGVPLSFTLDKIATAGQAGKFWIEELDQSAALMVVYGPSVSKGDKVNVSGALGQSGTQRALNSGVTVTPVSTGETCAKPVFMTEKTLGGTDYNLLTKGVTNGQGLYNVGLLVTIAGNVTSFNLDDPNNYFFYLDDGSNLVDGAEKGVKVRCGTIFPPTTGIFATVTGILTTELSGADTLPVIVVHDAGDIL